MHVQSKVNINDKHKKTASVGLVDACKEQSEKLSPNHLIIFDNTNAKFVLFCGVPLTVAITFSVTGQPVCYHWFLYQITTVWHLQNYVSIRQFLNCSRDDKH